MRTKLIRRRKLYGISQESLAKSVGVSRQWILNIEKNKRKPTVELCIKIAAVLHTTVEELFSEEADENNV